MYVGHPYHGRRLFKTLAFYVTADLTCRPRYRTSVVLPIRIYFVLRKCERVSQLQPARPSSTPWSHHDWTTGTLSCTVCLTASCTAFRWYSAWRPESSGVAVQNVKRSRTSKVSGSCQRLARRYGLTVCNVSSPERRSTYAHAR